MDDEINTSILEDGPGTYDGCSLFKRKWFSHKLKRVHFWIANNTVGKSRGSDKRLDIPLNMNLLPGVFDAFSI